MGMTKVTKASLAAAIAATDWDRVDALTDAEIRAAVAADPDAAPIITPERYAAGRVRVIRRNTGLSQAEFAARYGIPVGTLRDWEGGKSMPDTTAKSYLKAIGNEPELVARAFAA